MRDLTKGLYQHRFALAVFLVCAVAVSRPVAEVRAEDKASEKAESAHSEESAKGEEAAEKPKGPKRVAPKPLTPEDPRGKPDLTVCSQNLKLFGTFATVKERSPNYTKNEHTLKVEDLVKRFTTARCDVIAMQEVMGETEELAKAAVDELGAELHRVTNRKFASRVAPPSEGKMTLGYLIAEDRATIASALSYAKVDLPTLGEKQRPRAFQRTPMELQLVVNSRDTGDPKPISIVNFHFKSKRGGQADPTGLEWETYRMEMAEALRRIVESRHKQSFGSAESILMVLGDRNGNYDVASARILEGSLTLGNFRKDGGCRLSKRGVPLCKVGLSLPQRLFSVFASKERAASVPGTFSYKGEYSWLDDIMMPAESLVFAWKSAFKEGVYDSGVVYAPKDASDHALVYVRLNW